MTKWLKIHHVELKAQIASKNPQSASSLSEIWWVYFLEMQSFTASVPIAFNNIEDMSTLVEQQLAELSVLVLTHMEKIGCIGPLRDHYLDAISKDMHVKSCSFSVFVASVSEF